MTAAKCAWSVATAAIHREVNQEVDARSSRIHLPLPDVVIRIDGSQMTRIAESRRNASDVRAHRHHLNSV